MGHCQWNGFSTPHGRLCDEKAVCYKYRGRFTGTESNEHQI